MKISPTFFPDLELIIDTINKKEIFTCPSKNFKVEFYYDSPDHNGVIVNHQPLKVGNLNFTHPAVFNEMLRFRKSSSPPPMTSVDFKDPSPNSHTTGGWRRMHVSCAFANAVLGNQKGLDGLTQFNLDQLNRPFSHYPWTFKYDAYSGVHTSGWKYDTFNDIGGIQWDMFDPAHIEAAPQFSLAILQDPLGVVNMFMLIRAMIGFTPPNLTFWRNQPRSIGRYLVALERAVWVLNDMDDETLNTFFKGKKLKAHLETAIDSLFNDYPEFGTGNLDPRVMPNIGNGEIIGSYGWQEMLSLTDRVKVLNSGVTVAFKNTPAVKMQTYDKAQLLIAKTINSKGCSYAFSRHGIFTQGDLTLAQTKDPATLRELFQGTIRTPPRTSDCELGFWGFVMLDKNAQVVTDFLKILPKPGTSGYANMAHYLEPAYALLGI